MFKIRYERNWALHPLADTMGRFLNGKIKRDFTVTRHFLMDERDMIEVFAFDVLTNVNSSWVSQLLAAILRVLKTGTEAI